MLETSVGNMFQCPTEHALLSYRAWERNSGRALISALSICAVQPTRYRRYDWWGAALGMDVGAGSVILLAYNPEDAHLYKVGLYAVRVSNRPVLSLRSPKDRSEQGGHRAHL